MKKRGQVTIFILLGLFVVAVIVILLLFRSDVFTSKIGGEEGETFLEPQVNPIKERVRDCVEISAKEGENLIAIQGGYLDPPYYVQYAGEEDIKKSYGCYSGSDVYTLPLLNTLPTWAKLMDELSQYMSLPETKATIDECMSLEDFGQDGFDVDGDIDDMGTVFDGSQDEMRIRIIFPMIISKEDYVTEVDELALQYPSGMGTVYYAASDIVNKECLGETYNIDEFIITHHPSVYIPRHRYDNDFEDATEFTIHLMEGIIEGADPLTFGFIVQES